MSAVLDDLFAQLRQENVGPGQGGSGKRPAPEPTRTRGTTPEAGGKAVEDLSGSVGGSPLAGVNLGVERYDPNPRFLFFPEDADRDSALAFAERSMEAFELEEGPRFMQEPSRFTSERQKERPPLWVLRLPNGKPNYASASEQEKYLRESGTLAASVRSHASVKEGDVEPWEEWVAKQRDPRRQPPAGWEPETVQTPTERLASREIELEVNSLARPYSD